MPEEPRKMCPFSMPFAMPGRRTPGLMPGHDVQEIKVGFPCMGERCSFWVEKAEGCVIPLMFEQMIIKNWYPGDKI